jgi:probable HAF family extracellular repeat protein
MNPQLLSAAALASVLMAPQLYATAAESVGNITDLGTLGGQFSDAFGINNINGDLMSVEIVGRSTTTAGFLHAFVWTAPGPMVDLGTFGGNYAVAYEINNHGQIVGQSEDASRQRWAVVWTNTGAGWVIENLGTLTGACCAGAFGINNGTAGSRHLAGRRVQLGARRQRCRGRRRLEPERCLYRHLRLSVAPSHRNNAEAPGAGR